MNKTDLVDVLAQTAGISKGQAAKAFDAMISHTVEALLKGERVTVLGLGTMTVVQHRARTGRNPRTGAVMTIAARKAVKFSASLDLRKSVNCK
ncbi:MAG TPA: HU family DNA-binding protein [candidate division Zixibacteria bacterium]|nr:HU family DNA-binding protein [candidate division Zixibacteria bacterium]